MTVYNRRKPAPRPPAPTCGDVDRVEADGNVFYVTPEQTVRGDHAVYTYATDIVVVTGDVVAVRARTWRAATSMTVNTKTNDVKMESNATGRGKRRVRAVLYPDDKEEARR
jgi:lipopolysaccharide export system protein LptA